MTGTELRIWIRLRRRKLNGWKFRRQHPIGPYYVDFYCPAARLVVEIDGPGHELDASWAYDLRRQAWLEAEGYRVVRLHVSLIDQDCGAAIETIEAALDEQARLGLTPQPLRRLRRHLPINGEDHPPSFPIKSGGQPLRRLRRHLPVNGEDPPPR